MPAVVARHLVAIGVPASDIPLVSESVGIMVRTLTSLGYRQELSELASLTPESVPDLRNKLSNWARTVPPGDLAVLYFAGHGGAIGTLSKRHYLGLPGTDWERPVVTALASDELFRVLAESASLKKLLVILDTCNSGQALLDAQGIAASLQDGGNDRTFYVVTASRPKEEAGDSQFAAAFRDLIESQNGAAQRAYRIPALVQDLNARLAAQHANSAQIGGSEGDEPVFLPNPHYRAEALLGVPIEDRPYFQSDYLQHWKPRAIGSESIFQSGQWYFTGRLAALRKVALWLDQPNPAGKGLAITGDPGSGKSALLGCVLLAAAADTELAGEPYFRNFLASLPEDARPKPGAVTFSLVLRGMTLTDSLLALANRFQSEPDKVLAMLTGSTTGNIVLVFDAVDEADSPSAIADKLLRPLTGYPALKIIIGVRRPEFKLLGACFRPLDLDSADYRSDSDVAEYVERILLASGETRATPYRGHQPQAHAVSLAVAACAKGNYLVARTNARALMERDAMIDPAHEPLPGSMRDAFDEYLRRLGERSGIGDWRLRECLAPLAYVRGQGLPLSTWELFLPHDFYPAQILKIASAFIAEYSEEGRAVYRLYHQALADALRDPALDGPRQEKMARALYEAIPNWFRADWYTRKYFAPLAAAACPDLLEQALFDVKFLASAHVPLLLTTQDAVHTPEARRRFDWLKLASDRLTGSDPADRVAHLRLVALENGADDLAAECDLVNLDSRWRAQWTRWLNPVTPHRILSGHKGQVNSVAIADGVIVSGGNDYTVRFWNAATGEPMGEAGRHQNMVTSVAACAGVAISGGWDDVVRVWDLHTGRPMMPPLAGHQSRVLAVAISSEIAASAGDDRSVFLWDWRGQRAIAELKYAHTAPIHNLVISGGLVFSGAYDGTIRCWDMAGQTAHLEPIRSSGRMITALAVTENVIVSVSDYCILERWDLTTGRALSPPCRLEKMVNAIAIQDDTLACACNDFTVRLYDLATWRPKAQPFTGHGLFVRGVAFGSGMVASASADGTVRIWDLSAPGPIGRPSSSPGTGSAAAVAAFGNSRIAVARWDKRIEILDAATGALIQLKSQPDPGGIPIAAAADGSKVAYQGIRGLIVFDLDTGTSHRLTGKPECVAAGDGAIVSISDDQTLRRWDLKTLQPIGAPVNVRQDFLTTGLAVAEGVIWIGGAQVQRRDLRTGELLTEPVNNMFGTAHLAVDGDAAVGGSWDGRLRTYDPKSGKLLLENRVRAQSRITCIALSQGLAISGSDDGTLWAWNSATLQPVLTMRLGSPVNGLATTSDGVCAACAAGVVRIILVS